MSDPESLIDAQVFAELQDAAGADFVAELIGTFLEEAPPLLMELRRAIAAGDEGEMRRAAHSLKSNAQTFGATALGEQARALEHGGLAALSRAGAQADRLAALDAAYAAAAAALEACRHD